MLPLSGNFFFSHSRQELRRPRRINALKNAHVSLVRKFLFPIQPPGVTAPRGNNASENVYISVVRNFFLTQPPGVTATTKELDYQFQHHKGRGSDFRRVPIGVVGGAPVDVKNVRSARLILVSDILNS